MTDTSAPLAPADDARVADDIRELIGNGATLHANEARSVLRAYDALAARTAELERTVKRRDARIEEISNACNDVLVKLAAAREHARLLRVVADSLKDVEEKLLASDERDWVTASRMNIEKVAHALLKLPDRDGGPTP